MRVTPGRVFRTRAISALTLRPGELTALARLGALRHLDLQLLRRRQVPGGHSEAAAGDLLDAACRARCRSDPGPRPPSPELASPPRKDIASARTRWASVLSAPRDMAAAVKRRTMCSAGSTSSRGTGSRAAKVMRSRSWAGAAAAHAFEVVLPGVLLSPSAPPGGARGRLRGEKHVGWRRDAGAGRSRRPPRRRRRSGHGGPGPRRPDGPGRSRPRGGGCGGRRGR